jgi:hypothetical protein
MVKIEGSTTCICMRIRLLNVLRDCGVCRDTTRGCRAFVVLHSVVGVNDEQFTATTYWSSARHTGQVYRCVPVDRQTRCQTMKSVLRSLICSRNSKILFDRTLTLKIRYRCQFELSVSENQVISPFLALFLPLAAGGRRVPIEPSCHILTWFPSHKKNLSVRPKKLVFSKLLCQLSRRQGFGGGLAVQ